MKVDGNKRTAFVVMAVFLKVNGIDLMVPETEVVPTMLASFRWLNVRTGVRDLVVLWHRESGTSPLATGKEPQRHKGHKVLSTAQSNGLDMTSFNSYQFLAKFFDNFT